MSKMKPLYQQVLVIAGATSETGEKLIHLAVERGAKVFMIDLDEDRLQSIQDEMRRKGYDTAYSVANLNEIEQVQFAADQCIVTFGMIDSWINIPGTMKDSSKKIFEAFFWGLVNGSQTAIPYLSSGGALINVAGASKDENYPGEHVDHALRSAVKGYTEALRKELRLEKSKVKVTLISAGDSSQLAEIILKNTERPKKRVDPEKSWLQNMLPEKKSVRDRGLMASGIGGMAVIGGLTFFFMRKLRLL